MNGKRKQHTAEFRFKVALETLKGLKTVSELASILRGASNVDQPLEEGIARGRANDFWFPKAQGA
jgi:hypothetical protein